MKRNTSIHFSRKPRRLTTLVMLAAIVFAFFGGAVWGSDLSEMIRVYRNYVNLEVDGKPVMTDNFLYNGTTYIPLRAVSELLGKEVGWNAQTNVASIGEKVYEIEALSKLLPAESGYHWFYSGFAEYDHQMTLDSITDETTERTYSISGLVGDPSGGASTANLNLQLTYTIEGNRIIQQKSEERMMDSEYDRLILIQTPLTAGTFWTENVTDKDGHDVTLNSQITQVQTLDNGQKAYTVRYQQKGNPYYEQRIIREGVGVVAFEKLFQLEDGSFPAGYSLFEPIVMNEIDITLYFPDSSAEKVWPEVRPMQVEDGRTAWAALQGLIDGPETPGRYASIPSGTVVLDLSIENGICTVNFSREFIDNHPGGSAGELMTLASIINTLTEFRSIDKVMILVEGHAGETLGNIVLDQAMGRMTDMLSE